LRFIRAAKAAPKANVSIFMPLAALIDVSLNLTFYKRQVQLQGF